ncbi:MAG: hypothetical protein PUF31_03255 [Oscillospiraceae bacterium]|nr:hypothetical protein [Oscillospiraceae bacterium]
MSKWKEFTDSFDKDVRTGVAIALAVVVLFGSGNFLGGLVSKNKDINSDSSVAETQATTAPTTIATTVPTTLPPATEATTAAQPANADASAASDATASSDASAPAGDATTAAEAASTGAPTDKAGIIKLYNESANKIKTNATKVVRNYEDLRHDEQYLEMPSLLKSVGSGLISKFLKRNDTPVEYASNADIIANYPVKGQNYVSQATEADITDATCTDDGTNYNITLKFAECTDPQGTGCANAFNIITSEEIAEGSGGIVSESSVRYYDATITCKIDKATGNMVSATYVLPMVLSVKAMGINAAVGMTFEHDYTITY